MREVEGRNKSREIWYFKTLAHGVGGESKRGSKGKRREERDESMEKRKELEGRRRTGEGRRGEERRGTLQRHSTTFWAAVMLHLGKRTLKNGQADSTWDGEHKSFFIYFLLVLEAQSRASYSLGTLFITELYPQLPFHISF